MKYHALVTAAALLVAGSAAAAPLKVVGRFLQDAHGNNILMRGVNLPVYKSGYLDDLDPVAAAIALTKANAVRLEWWAVPSGGTTEYTVANLDRAIQKFYDLGIIPVVELHDLTFQYGHDDKVGPNSDGNDRTTFANTITAFWTRADVVAVLVKHQDHLVINLANEWGSSYYSDSTPTTANFIQNYTDAITAMRNAGITAPLMVDAPKGFEYQFLLDHGAALLAADPQGNTMLSVHAYWAASDPAFTVANVNAILDTFMNSGLPVVLGEASSNAWTVIPCDPINYANLLTRANTDTIGYLFWAWYEDGQCGQEMNITVGADGVTRPTIANPGFGYDALYHPAFGIDTAQPPTQKADFSPVAAPVVTTASSASITATSATLGGNVTSDGGSAITERGVVYSLTATNANPLIGGTGVTKVTVIGTTGLFTTGVSGLQSAAGYSFKAFATNAVGTGYTAAATFTTSCPTIALGSLPDGSVNAPYAGSAAATGGDGPYTYAVTSGFLPPGLSLTASGAGAGNVGGTPGAEGTFPFDITATDTSGAGACTGVGSYSLVIGPEQPGQDFFTLTPCRILDTRNPVGPLGGPALAALSDRTFPAAGTCGIPADAKAISLNIAVTGSTNPGNIRLHPGGTAVPLVSAINFKAGQTRSNNAVIPLSALGELAAYLDQATGTAHLILDVNGYFK